MKMDNINNNDCLYQEEMLNFLSILNNSNRMFLEYDKILNKVFVDKKQTKIILEKVSKIFYNYLYNKNTENENINVTVDKILKKIDNLQIIRVIQIIEEEKQKLKYNVNFKLWLDNFLINLVEVLNCG